MSEAISSQPWKDNRLSWGERYKNLSHKSKLFEELSVLAALQDWWPTSRGVQELPTDLLHVSRGVYQRKLHVLLLYRCRYNSDDRKISLQRYLCSNIDYLAARCQSCCCCLRQTPAEQGRKMTLSLLYPCWTIPNYPPHHLSLLHFLVAERCRLTLQNAWSYSERNKQGAWLGQEFLLTPHTPLRESSRSWWRDTCGFGSLYDPCIMGRKRVKNKPVEAARVAKPCSGWGSAGLPSCRAAACTLPKSVLGGQAMVEAAGMWSYSSCIPTMAVGKSLSHVPPNLFFITSLGLGVFLTLCLCSVSLCMGLSLLLAVPRDIVLLIYTIRRQK